MTRDLPNGERVNVGPRTATTADPYTDTIVSAVLFPGTRQTREGDEQ